MNIEEITKELEQGVKGLYTSDSYKEYLDFMGKFHNYSVNNSILIFMQMPNASLVAGYQAWQKKFGRQVKQGEKGIRILAPVPHKMKKEVKTADGDWEEKEITWNTFRPVCVFDVSQTEGNEIPEICKDLTGKVDGYDGLIEKLISVSPVKVEYEDIKLDAVKGYFNGQENSK